MTLHICPEADREKWLAELDIDPNVSGGKIRANASDTIAKLAICSLHFREGYPTDQFPLPTELLTDKLTEKIVFKGQSSAKSPESSDDLKSSGSDEEEELKFSKLCSKLAKKSPGTLLKKALNAKRKRRNWIPSVDYSDKKAMELKRKKIAHCALFGSKIHCRFCHLKLKGTKQYFKHVKQYHLPNIVKNTNTDEVETKQLPATPVSKKVSNM